MKNYFVICLVYIIQKMISPMQYFLEAVFLSIFIYIHLSVYPSIYPEPRLKYLQKTDLHAFIIHGLQNTKMRKGNRYFLKMENTLFVHTIFRKRHKHLVSEGGYVQVSTYKLDTFTFGGGSIVSLFVFPCGGLCQHSTTGSFADTSLTPPH